MTILPIHAESQEILTQHFPLLRQYLQCEAVFPYLVQKKLLTQAQQSELTLLTLGPYEKVDRLLLYLPRSRPDFLELFVDCLRQSADGTNHEKLANELEKAMANGTLPGERGLWWLGVYVMLNSGLKQRSQF